MSNKVCLRHHVGPWLILTSIDVELSVTVPYFPGADRWTIQSRRSNSPWRMITGRLERSPHGSAVSPIR